MLMLIHEADLDNEANNEGNDGADHGNDRNYVVTLPYITSTDAHYL